MGMKLSEQEMEVYLKFNDWIRVDDDNNGNHKWHRKESIFDWKTSNAFEIQMRIDGHYEKIN
jgi:hypothetical protein